MNTSYSLWVKVLISLYMGRTVLDVDPQGTVVVVAGVSVCTRVRDGHSMLWGDRTTNTNA